MLDVMYELPESNSEGVTFIVDAESLQSKLTLAEMPQRKAKESA
jgi:hypothetical protein